MRARHYRYVHPTDSMEFAGYRRNSLMIALSPSGIALSVCPEAKGSSLKFEADSSNAPSRERPVVVLKPLSWRRSEVAASSWLWVISTMQTRRVYAVSLSFGPWPFATSWPCAGNYAKNEEAISRRRHKISGRKRLNNMPPY